MQPRKAVAAVGLAAAVTLAVMADGVDPAGAQTFTYQKATVINGGFGYAKSGSNYVVGNKSTSTGNGTNTSTGTAVVVTGPSIGIGSASFTWIVQH